MQAMIQKWGNSQGIRIPKAFLEALGMTENDLVELNRVDDNIVITISTHDLTKRSTPPCMTQLLMVRISTHDLTKRSTRPL